MVGDNNNNIVLNIWTKGLIKDNHSFRPAILGKDISPEKIEHYNRNRLALSSIDTINREEYVDTNRFFRYCVVQGEMPSGKYFFVESFVDDSKSKKLSYIHMLIKNYSDDIGPFMLKQQSHAWRENLSYANTRYKACAGVNAREAYISECLGPEMSSEAFNLFLKKVKTQILTEFANSQVHVGACFYCLNEMVEVIISNPNAEIPISAALATQIVSSTRFRTGYIFVSHMIKNPDLTLEYIHIIRYTIVEKQSFRLFCHESSTFYKNRSTQILGVTGAIGVGLVAIYGPNFLKAQTTQIKDKSSQNLKWAGGEMVQGGIDKIYNLFNKNVYEPFLKFFSSNNKKP
jgi:hypothetical protein